MSIEDFSVSRRTGFRGYFWESKESVFVNAFSISKSPCAQNLSLSAVELCFWMVFGWFLGPKELVFINGFWATSRLCPLKISASAVELGFEDICGTARTPFSSTVSQSAKVHMRRTSFRQRFLSQQYSMCSKHFNVRRRTRFPWWFMSRRQCIFR
jgi:hypothetical protein